MVHQHLHRFVATAPQISFLLARPKHQIEYKGRSCRKHDTEKNLKLHSSRFSFSTRSSLKMFRLQCGLFLLKIFHLQFGDGTFLTQDVSLAVLGWRLLVCHSNIAISISAAIPILHCGPQYFCMEALAQCTLTKRWVLEVHVSIVVGSRHTAELGWAVLGSHLETNIWHVAEVFAAC